jgi:pimeloyl-ACP methyl ester carboxylesterase
VPVAAGLHYQERGDGPPLLLSHGVIESARSFASLGERLAGRFRTIAYDARGRGRSPGEPISYRQLVDDVAALAAALRLAPFHHVGHSMGGRVALEHAVAHPEQVRTLTVMSARAEAPDERGRERLRRLIERVRRHGSGAAADMWIERSDPLYREVSQISAANPLEGTVAALRCLVRMDSFVARLGELRAPTLVIVGDRDEAYLRSGTLMAERIAGAQLAVLEDVGHFPNLQVPDLVAERLVAFLA